MKYEIRLYVEGDACPFEDWQNSLSEVMAVRVDRYVKRLAAGNFGAAKALQHGVSELRLDFGPGYRVYFGVDGKTLVILLGGGDKSTQRRDIEKAVSRWMKYKSR